MTYDGIGVVHDVRPLFEPSVTPAPDGSVEWYIDFTYLHRDENQLAKGIEFSVVITMPSGQKKIGRVYAFMLKSIEDVRNYNLLAELFADLIWTTLCDVSEARNEPMNLLATRDRVALGVGVIMDRGMN